MISFCVRTFRKEGNVPSIVFLSIHIIPVIIKFLGNKNSKNVSFCERDETYPVKEYSGEKLCYYFIIVHFMQCDDPFSKITALISLGKI